MIGIGIGIVFVIIKNPPNNIKILKNPTLDPLTQQTLYLYCQVASANSDFALLLSKKRQRISIVNIKQFNFFYFIKSNFLIISIKDI